MDHRTERISEAIREELAELIGYEMADPRVPPWVSPTSRSRPISGGGCGSQSQNRAKRSPLWTHWNTVSLS